ncbi:acetate kinase [Lecanosticta acicola]|uniref:Probable acetate kinase n=1 Tax=Lecanosticta acicola TaxID=111012 RepID=A0AAI8YY55_9PEZI|nr:acetate kinase [Lecanosticta acicola]
MPRIILAINAGSSSVKVSVYSYEGSSEPKELAGIQVSGLTAPPSKLKYDRGDQHIKDQELPSDVKGQEGAFQYIIKHLTSDSGLDALSHPDDIEFACHRIVHGGDYDRPTRIDKDTYHHLEALSDLAPLHNAGALTIVKATYNQCPKATNIAFFDSSFHATIPRPLRTYAIDPKIAKHNKLRKYGFHGLSYAFIARSVASFLHKPLEETNLIALHLGSGASCTAIRGGKSLDTSMGLTPLAGLPGATRSGDVDPSLIFHFTSDAGKLSPTSTKDMSITQAEEILNKKSGWSVLTGTTDFGNISQRAEQGDDEACTLAFDLFVDRILGFVGSYYVKLGGKVDGLAFAGGIGEKGVQLRKAVLDKVACLGFELDEGRNAKPDDGMVADIGTRGSRHRVLVCQTDEEVEMAMQCAKQADELRRQ